MNKYMSNKMRLVAAMFAATTSMYAGSQQDMKSMGCNSSNLCTLYPAIESHHLHFDIGFLLEQVRMTGTDLGYTTSGNVNTLPKTVELLRPDFKLKWGLTAGAGYYFDHDNWFINSRFDWISSEGKQNHDCVGSDRIVPTGIWTNGILNGSDATYFTSVRDELEIDYYMLVVDLNRGTYLTGNFAVEPHAGVKANWIFYNNKVNLSGGSSGTNTLHHKQKTKFWGAGPEFGLDTKWNFMCGFQAFCDASLALLIGESRAKDEQWYDVYQDTYVATALEKPAVMAPVLSNTMGFQYNKVMCDGTQNFRARIAIDTSFYWNQFQHMRVANETTAPKFYLEENGSFALVGLLVDIGWDY